MAKTAFKLKILYGEGNSEGHKGPAGHGSGYANHNRPCVINGLACGLGMTLGNAGARVGTQGRLGPIRTYQQRVSG